jgi:hypothetical protein
MHWRQPESSAKIERLARAFCSGDQDAALLCQARVLAVNELALRAVREQKLAMIERLRDPTAASPAHRDDSLRQARARLKEGKCADKKIKELIPLLAEKYKDRLPPVPPNIRFIDRNEIILSHLTELLELTGATEEENRIEDAKPQNERQEREQCQEREEEYDAMEKAAADLTRLERYERRAWSRYRRALCDFIETQRQLDLDGIVTPR